MHVSLFVFLQFTPKADHTSVLQTATFYYTRAGKAGKAGSSVAHHISSSSYIFV